MCRKALSRWICAFKFGQRQTDRQTDRATIGQLDLQMEREKHRHTDKVEYGKMDEQMDG